MLWPQGELAHAAQWAENCAMEMLERGDPLCVAALDRGNFLQMSSRGGYVCASRKHGRSRSRSKRPAPRGKLRLLLTTSIRRVEMMSDEVGASCIGGDQRDQRIDRRHHRR